ncbi:C3 and PZP-like alpha-2-macroglobulin domain-containing protein 8 [Condylostylus longicornis]|uniref:C3 and PZP-like alpha-2-macroglobulin domain-containing protein 8 n=1 Tax=Condylostylus longicornis TaxID=2530218 RepID=UPI00244DB817|nr:C3 and PZP-like alpha-2-macroglobulin domain-containing protein 8 [Condylostylus longicornis]
MSFYIILLVLFAIAFKIDAAFTNLQTLPASMSDKDLTVCQKNEPYHCALISLSNSPQFIDPTILIQIGECNNKESNIEMNKIEVVKSHTPDFLNKDEYRPFWIKWSLQGKIMVGKGNDIIPFLVYQHTEQIFPINFIGLRTRWSDGYWIINEGNACHDDGC